MVRLIQDGELHAHVPGAVWRKLRLADVPDAPTAGSFAPGVHRFITESSAELADADADEVAELLAEAKRAR